MAVATISGTVGFEASCAQKNVFFWRDRFKGMPNCYDLKTPVLKSLMNIRFLIESK